MRRKLILAGRILLGAVFLYAAYTKLRQPWVLFAMSINSYQLLPEWAVTPLARALPWFELLLGAWLISGMALRASAAVSSGLLGLFFAVMLRAYFKGQAIDCGCFGLGEALGPETLARDGALVIASLLVFWGATREAGRRSAPPPAPATERRRVRPAFTARLLRRR